MRRRRAEEPSTWEPLHELLGGWEDPSGHLRAAKRELLLFLKELIERELADMDGRPPARRSSPRRRQTVPVRRRQAGYHPR